LLALQACLKHGLSALPTISLCENGILFCGDIILADLLVTARRRVQADTCGKTKTAPDWVPFLFWCG